MERPWLILLFWVLLEMPWLSNESNAKMGLVCATPTAGSAGCLPAVLTTAIEKLGLSQSQQLDFLFTAGAFGLVIANNASISWCRRLPAEVGSASAMAAAAITMAAGGYTFPGLEAICFVTQKYVRTHLRPCSRIG